MTDTGYGLRTHEKWDRRSDLFGDLPAVRGDLAVVERGPNGEVGVEEDEVGLRAHGDGSHVAAQPQGPRRVRGDEGQGFL